MESRGTAQGLVLILAGIALAGWLIVGGLGQRLADRVIGGESKSDGFGGGGGGGGSAW